jgi:hypothetical protein
VFPGSRATRWEKRNSSTSLYLMEGKLGLPMFGWHRLRHHADSRIMPSVCSTDWAFPETDSASSVVRSA